MSEYLNNAVGTQLKLARSAKEWSLDLTSKHTGVSKAMLGQIERGESSPTVARLWKIANGFNLPLSYFLGTIDNNGNTEKVLRNESGISISTIFPFDPKTKSEMFYLTLSPQHQQMSEPHNDGVIEHIVVIEGTLEYFLNGKWHLLQKGEAAKFTANQTHGYRNMSGIQTVFHNVIYYTIEDKLR